MSAQEVQPVWSGARVRALGEYALLLSAVVVLIGGGYLVFRAFVATPDVGKYNLYMLAVVAGVASFFSPCAFPLLPSYLSFYYLARGQTSAGQRGYGRALSLGLAAALGVITFDLILDLMIAALGAGVAQGLAISSAQPNTFVRFFRGGVGLALLTLGLGQLGGWNLKPAFVDAFAYRTRPQRQGERSAALNLYLYGLGYNAAGMGCTGPILAGLIILALASGGFVSAITAFGVFSLTMGALIVIVSALVGASQQTLILRLKAAAPKIKWASAVLLVLVGAFHIYAALNVGLFVRLLFP